MNQTKSQTSSPTAEMILSGTAKGRWRKKHGDSEPPPSTLEACTPEAVQAFTHTVSERFIPGDLPIALRKQYRDEVVIVEGDTLRVVSLEREVQAQRQALDKFAAHIEKHMGDEETIGEVLDKFPFPDEYRPPTQDEPRLAATDFPVIADYLLSTAGVPTEGMIQWLYQEWLRVKADHPNLNNPLETLIDAWTLEHIAPPRPREYDRTYPGAVMPQKSVSSVRYPFVETITEARTAPLEAPSAAQLLLPTFERKMYLPEYLPAQIVQGVNMTGRDGVLPYTMRFFYEVGMSLKPKQRTGYYSRTLYDAAVDIGIIDPNSEERNKRSLRARDKEAIQNAIELLNEIRLPYREPVGGVGLWLPFRPLNIPTRLSEKDFPIRVWVQLPLDDKRGVLVVREIVRSLYQNLPQLNAYLAACTIFNQYGLSPKNVLIDPTEPDPNTPRLETGQLVHPKTGEPLFNKQGKPIDDLFDPDAFEPLKPYRPYRKEANNYPTLEEEEILRAVYPHEPYKKNKQERPQWIKRAWEAWEAIAQAGHIRIERKGDGLQILPSDSHVRLHHEVMESSKKG